ncbi:MAG TPA: zinc ribbon domain-containing protein [Clostridiaceae bacterium]|nr:zinc ribbon domain-containing protein [Clostridiaceae bacterium]
MFCQQCGAKNEDYSKFCIKCGAKISLSGDAIYTGGGIGIGRVSGTPAMVTEIKTTQESIDSKDYFGNRAADSKKKYLIKKIIAGVALCAAVIAVIIGVVNIFKGSKPKTVSRDLSRLPIMYIKSSDLMLKRNGNKEPYVVTSVGGNYYYGDILFTEDGKTMFFADDPSNGEFKLYYRKVDEEKPKGKGADSIGIRIASGVTDFDIQKDGEFVVYKKGDKLYYTDLKKEDRLIAKDVSYFLLSNDEKKVVFRNHDGEKYLASDENMQEPVSLLSISIALKGGLFCETMYNSLMPSSDSG